MENIESVDTVNEDDETGSDETNYDMSEHTDLEEPLASEKRKLDLMARLELLQKRKRDRELQEKKSSVGQLSRVRSYIDASERNRRDTPDEIVLYAAPAELHSEPVNEEEEMLFFVVSVIQDY